MKRVFADTAYFVALVRKRDQLHRQAIHFQECPPGKLLTTEWVLTEAGNRLAEPLTRERFIRFLAELRAQAGVEIVSARHEHFKKGCDLYARRKDKDWSLTDCISFVVMQEYGIDSALTSDEDFEQAGFKRLMDPGPHGVREPAARYGATMDQTVENNAMREVGRMIASAVGSNDEFPDSVDDVIATRDSTEHLGDTLIRRVTSRNSPHNSLHKCVGTDH